MDDIEFRLRAFRPRRPGPLEEHFERRRMRVLSLVAVAAGLAVAVLIGWRVERSLRNPAESVESATLGSLTTLALTDPVALDRMLMEVSRASLPDVGRPGSAFEQLAKP